MEQAREHPTVTGASQAAEHVYTLGNPVHRPLAFHIRAPAQA